MLTIFYSPHMTSIDNEAGRASGHADVPLSANGRQLAQELGQHYAAEILDAVFCSDLQRAVAAMLPLRKLQLRPGNGARFLSGTTNYMNWPLRHAPLYNGI